MTKGKPWTRQQERALKKKIVVEGELILKDVSNYWD